MLPKDELYLQRQLKLLMKSTKSALISALSRMLPRADIDDVLQETYLIWYQKSQEQHIENNQAYIFRVARNIAISRLRSAKVQQAYQQDCALHNNGITASLSTKLAESQTHTILTEAINTLPPLCKQIFILRKLHGKSHHEISQTFGISVKTIENHITKGMHHCRQYVVQHVTTTTKVMHEL